MTKLLMVIAGLFLSGSFFAPMAFASTGNECGRVLGGRKTGKKVAIPPSLLAAMEAASALVADRIYSAFNYRDVLAELRRERANLTNGEASEGYRTFAQLVRRHEPIHPMAFKRRLTLLLRDLTEEYWQKGWGWRSPFTLLISQGNTFIEGTGHFSANFVGKFHDLINKSHLDGYIGGRVRLGVVRYYASGMVIFTEKLGGDARPSVYPFPGSVPFDSVSLNSIFSTENKVGYLRRKVIFQEAQKVFFPGDLAERNLSGTELLYQRPYLYDPGSELAIDRGIGKLGELSREMLDKDFIEGGREGYLLGRVQMPIYRIDRLTIVNGDVAFPAGTLFLGNEGTYLLPTDRASLDLLRVDFDVYIENTP